MRHDIKLFLDKTYFFKFNWAKLFFFLTFFCYGFYAVISKFNNELLQTIPPQDLIWMMNNIADNSEMPVDMAQDGTEIGSERERFIKFLKENEGGHDYIRNKNSAPLPLGRWAGG